MRAEYRKEYLMLLLIELCSPLKRFQALQISKKKIEWRVCLKMFAQESEIKQIWWDEGFGENINSPDDLFVIAVLIGPSIKS